MKYILRFLIFVHRWVGVALCVVFLFWFPSGIGMMYWRFPEVTAEDRLDRSPNLDPAKIVLSPDEAAEKAGIQASPTQVRLNSFDGRPVYRFGGGAGRGGGRGSRGGRIIYADTGEEQTEVSTVMLDRMASVWAGRPFAEAKKVSVEEPDQWTVAALRNLRPMYKYSWPDGQQVYLNGMTGEVVQYTTFAKRVAAHVSAIPHWLYYTPLRKHQPQWLRFMIRSSLIGTAGAMIGIVVAVWMYSPKKKYRLDRRPTGIPYRGQKRWHWIFGIVFGLATVTWTFSGLMTLGPFPIVQRLTGTEPRSGQRGQQQEAQQSGEEPQQQAAASQRGEGRGQRGELRNGQRQPADKEVAGDPSDGQRRGFGRGGQGRGGDRRRGKVVDPPRDNTAIEANRGGSQSEGATSDGRQVAANPSNGGRGGSPQGIAGALRGRVTMADFASVHPRDLLTKVPNVEVKELEWTSFAGEPLFNANLGGGKSQLLSRDGTTINGFATNRVIDIVKSVVPEPNTIDIKVIDQYDLYYLDRTRQRPLPVIRVLINDDEKTRYYIDPKSARIVTTYSNRNWVNRWLYAGLHSLNFPFLYNHRPLWDIVVIIFMVGGTALCVTSLVLAWRTLGRKLRRIAANDLLPSATDHHSQRVTNSSETLQVR